MLEFALPVLGGTDAAIFLEQLAEVKVILKSDPLGDFGHTDIGSIMYSRALSILSSLTFSLRG